MKNVDIWYVFCGGTCFGMALIALMSRVWSLPAAPDGPLIVLPCFAALYTLRGLSGRKKSC